MRYFAQIENGQVTRVIVANNIQWCQSRLGGEWIETRDPYAVTQTDPALDGVPYAGIGWQARGEFPRRFARPGDQVWQPFALWSGAVEPPPIYLPDDAPPRNVEAANRLADMIETASGKTRPSVIQQPVATAVPNWAIKVGYPYDSETYEETLISFERGSPIELTGVDEFDPLNPNLVGQMTETNYMKRSGTYDAVMSFARDHLGVVTAWPGPRGKHIPAAAEKTIYPTRAKHEPSALFRMFLGFSAPGNTSPFAKGRQWLREHGGFYCAQASGGHPLTPLFNKFHPLGNPGGDKLQIFALQPDGSRGYPLNGRVKLEVGEPELIDVWEQEIVDGGLVANPFRITFGMGFSDGYRTGHSVDPRARAMDYTGPDAIPYRYSYADSVFIDHVVMSDREVRFANLCDDRLQTSYSDKGYWTAMLAYGPTRPAPKEAIPNPRVIVVGTFSDVLDPNNVGEFGVTERSQLDDWLDVTPNVVWRPGLGTAMANREGGFLTNWKELGERYKSIIDRGCMGFIPDGFYENWATQWPVYYIFARLNWDHTIDIDAEMDAVYAAMFGPAAEHIKAFYDATAQAIMETRIEGRTRPEQVVNLWTTERLDALEAHMLSAEAAVAPGSPEASRVEWVRGGLDWVKVLTQCNQNYLSSLLPVTVTDPANLMTGANAIESDVDGVTGWTGRFGSALPISQSEVTNGSQYAFRCITAEGCTRVQSTALPGTGDNVYLASIDMKHIGSGQRWAIYIEERGEPSGPVTITDADTEWETYRFLVYGGETITILKWGSGGGGGCYVDNLVVQSAEFYDYDQFLIDWQAALDAGIAESIDHAKWEGFPPIGDGGKFYTVSPSNAPPPPNNGEIE